MKIALLASTCIILTACGGDDNSDSAPLITIGDQDLLTVAAWTTKLMLREYRFPDGKERLRYRRGYDGTFGIFTNIENYCLNNQGTLAQFYGDLADDIVDIGDRVQDIFSDCLIYEFDDPANGSVTVEVLDISKTLSPLSLGSENYYLDYQITYQNLYYEEDTLNGTKQVNINQSTEVEASTTTIRRFEEDGWDYYSTLKNFTIISNRNRSTGAFTFEMDGTYVEQDLEGAVNIITSETITFPPHSELSYPDGGAFIISGANDSAMSVTYSDLGADVEYFDGVDVFTNFFATWSELNDSIQKELFPQTKQQ